MVNIRIAEPEDGDAIELLTRLLIGERKETFDPKRFEWGILRRIMDPFQRQGYLFSGNRRRFGATKKSRRNDFFRITG